MLKLNLMYGSAKVWFLPGAGPTRQHCCGGTRTGLTGKYCANTRRETDDLPAHPVPSGSTLTFPHAQRSTALPFDRRAVCCLQSVLGSPNPPKPADATDPNYKTTVGFF